MAILWRKKINNTEYEVRSAGNTRRLFTDGVFHSQYNDKQPVTGAIWDLLLLPAFFHERQKMNNVLVLGVGGGAVIKQLQYFLKPQRIDAVDLNATHLMIAKRFFNVRQKQVRLIHAEARQWLLKQCAHTYDYIIDDIFGEHNGEAVRPIEANTRWFSTLMSKLNPGGSLVINFGSPQELKQSAYCQHSRTRKTFKAAFMLESPRYENAIGAFLTTPASAKNLRRNLAQFSQLNTKNKSCKLRFKLKTI